MLEDKMLEKMREMLSVLGLGEAQIDDAERYMQDELEEGVLFNTLPHIDLDTLSYQESYKIDESYKMLKRLHEESKRVKWIKMMIHIGQASMVSILNRCESMPYEKFSEEMLSYGMDPSFLVHSYVKMIISSEYQFKSNFRKVLHPVYDLYPDAFEKAWEQGDTNTKLCIASYLVQKNSKRYGELKKWMESVIKNSLETLFENCGITNNQLESMKKYLEGGVFDSDKIIDEVKNQVQPNTLKSYILSILCGFCYLIIQESKLAKRFLRLMMGVQYQETYQKLYDFVVGTERLTLFETLHQELDIPKEWEVAWMASQSPQNSHNFSKELRIISQKDRKIFEKAIQILQGQAKVYLCRFLWGQGEGQEYISSAEEICIAESKELLHALDYHPEIIKQAVAYLEGHISFEEIRAVLQQNKNNKIGYFYYGSYMQTVFWLKDTSPLLSRTMRLYAHLRNDELMKAAMGQYENAFQKRDKIDMFIEFLRSSGVGIDMILPFVAEYTVTGYHTANKKTAEKLVEKYIQETPKEAKQCIAACSAEARAILLEKLFAADPKQQVDTLIEYFGDTAKVVKEKIIGILTGMPEFFPQVEPMLSAKKQAQREIAVRILVAWKDEHSIEALRKVLDSEKNEKIKNLIVEALDVDQKAERDDSQFDITAYCKAAVKGNQKSVIQWLQIDTLPKIRLKDREALADPIVLEYMLISYGAGKEVAVSRGAKQVSEYLHPRDLADVAVEVYSRWMEDGVQAKRKWVLAFVAIHGDERIILALKKNIEEWPQNARGAMACQAVRALALGGSKEALLLVDGFGRKFKFKQVKEAALEALSFAAKELGMDLEDLSDIIVPTLGFDRRGEQVFDYGDRKFIARLTADLSIEIESEEGKLIKSLPTPGKKDDPEKAEAAKAAFSMMKKQLKTTAKIQSERLEMALSVNRLWTNENWKKLFVENPLMHQFAMGLLWGVYTEGKLTDTFRYMEDGTCNTKDEEEYTLPQQASIGVVHPIELDQEEIQLWKQQLEDYEITQPFEQLNRPIYRVTQEEEKLLQVERFGGIMLNGYTLSSKLMKFGWYRGSVQDGGWYHTFYKENHKLGIGVELEFSGAPIGYEEDEVTVYALQFYKSGTVQRGSYIYDEVKKQDIIQYGNVPERFCSEILYEVDRTLVGKTGRNEMWKKEA